MKINLLFIIFLCGFFWSCSNTENDAFESIIGEWNITEIHSEYGTFSENSVINTSSLSENGQIGDFSFTKDSVNFNYTRNDTMYSGNTTWNLVHDRVNSGFVQVDQFRLSIDDFFLFDVSFEDGTNNSEKNAMIASFTQIPIESTHLLITLSLEK